MSDKQDAYFGYDSRRPHMNAADLVLAVLAELRQKDAAPSKTKLLKLLYLVDVENARSSGQTATEWDWIFLHFGPWTPKYDDVLDDLARRGFISLKVGGADERATIISTERPDLDSSKLDAGVQLNIGRVVGRWGRADLGEILNFVYFDTEPMQDAERKQPLDFSKVPKGRISPYRRAVSDVDQKTLMNLRAKIRITESADNIKRSYTPPRYDEEILRAFAALEED